MRTLFSILLLGSSLSVAAPGLAQQRSLDSRVDKLEKEMQAVQRKVFPGGAGQIIAPDVVPPAPQATPSGSPASAPIADLTARVNAIESQLARLTGQAEENGYKLRQLEENYTKLAAEFAALKAAAAPPPEAIPLPAVPTTAAPAAGRPAAGTRTPAAAVAKPDAAASPARVQAVAAIERPSTGNAALDNYTYGFRLWTAKFFPEAQTQLQTALDNYPNDPVASRTANLLGRAYLDDKKPTQAAKILFENYRLRPKGDRAAESLAWTGEALIQLNRLKEACMAYDELTESFTGIVPPNVADMMKKGRVRAKCSG
jgi:TolA-binding protein